MTIIKFQKYLLEHGFSRVMRILWGDVPNINQFGIVTANNPGYRQMSDEENKEMNRQLVNQLMASNYGPIPIKGKFEGTKEEESYLIPNIDKGTLLSYGRHYKQSAVIWGKKKNDADGTPYIEFEWIDCDSEKVTQRRYVVMSGGEVQNRADSYSKKKGRKFTIPFWGDRYKDYLPAAQRGKIERPFRIADLRPSSQDVLPAAEWEILDVSHQGLDAFLSESLPATKDVKAILDEIRQHEQMMNDENISGKGHWVARGKMIESLRELKELVNSQVGINNG